MRCFIIKFNFDLFTDILWLSAICGIISSAFIQKLKELKFIKNSRLIAILSFFITLFISFITSKTFTNLSNLICLEVAIFSFIGSSTIYEKLKSVNIFKSSKDIFDDKDLR